MTTNRIKSMVISLFLCLIVGSGGYLRFTPPPSEKNNGKDHETKSQEAVVKEQSYRLLLSQKFIKQEGEEHPFIEVPLLDYVCYDLDEDGSDELVAIGLGAGSTFAQGRWFGDNLLIYDLTVSEGQLMAELIYSNPIASVSPWMVEVGKLDTSEAKAHIFVGVYKDTTYYKEVINRPFFFTWNGAFIERKWTGSFLSYDELMDMVFVDFTGDGVDEIALLEQEAASGLYKVSIYKWLTFGFEKLIESKAHYEAAGEIRVDEQKKIWIQTKEGSKQVDFKG